MKKILMLLTAALALSVSAQSKTYDITAFGAVGDGKTISSDAVNAAIQAAAADGGGTVYVPAGRYLCYSIRLASHVDLHLEKGACIVAAAPGKGSYDVPEDNPYDKYQDFGHSHFHNSLIWGDGIEDFSITGLGIIDGEGLVRVHEYSENPGGANKLIALRECRNVVLRDVTLYRCGHFGLLATGLINLAVTNVKVDTDNDGFDIDGCFNVTITGCMINSAHDDGICLKSSYALGRYIDTENVSITGCNVSGYAMGTMLDGTRGEVAEYDCESHHKHSGRIKFGTESSAGFKNISVTGCTLDYCGGILLESVDGGDLQDVVISNITIRDCVDTPIFLRLGARMRSPEGREVGHIRRVLISDINSYGARADFSNIISGIPGHCIEDVTLRNIHLHSLGGFPDTARGALPPEKVDEYPDSHRFGIIPARGMMVRHARHVTLDGIHFSFAEKDDRPLMVFDDVEGMVMRDITDEHVPVKMKLKR